MRFILMLGLCAALLVGCQGRSPAAPDASSSSQTQNQVASQPIPEPPASSEQTSQVESVAQTVTEALNPVYTTGNTSETKISWNFTPAADPASVYVELDVPMLVNTSHLLPEEYEAVALWVTQLPYPFAQKGMTPLLDMITTAKQDGIELVLISGYRSVASQQRNFSNNKKKLMEQGYTEAQAEQETARYFAYPRASEHNLGLAADLNSLEESFENTAQFQWLQENAWKYGFILRYPKDKTDITGISYEPWHYRYVGSNHAKAMNDQGLCLEEYWETLG